MAKPRVFNMAIDIGLTPYSSASTFRPPDPPFCKDYFQRLLKPQKSAILTYWDSVADCLRGSNGGGAYASSCTANPWLKQRTGERLRLASRRGSVLARRFGLPKRALIWRGGLPSAFVVLRFSLNRG